MQFTANFTITADTRESYEEVSKLVKEYFADPELYHPEYFDFWIKEMRFRPEQLTIENINDVHADHFDYEPLLDGLVEHVCSHLPNAKLNGDFDLYCDDWGSTYHFFTAENGKVAWNIEEPEEYY